ncbi:hypothetical protein JYU34_010955 [Plutella xylostella]|uniref:ATP-dependent RNA helicase n=1 Tax=Plutella xylostella TaxID=51655 RepID=A0ABQ7QFP1_PLUXY|nr:hypothetical protein JYU34_010955 [Plutella xylostella]
MDDLQLNITVSKKVPKKQTAHNKSAKEFKFVSKPEFTGKTIARKRPQNLIHQQGYGKKHDGEPQTKVAKVAEPQEKSSETSSNLRDLSENKGKFHGKNYQHLSDDIQLKQKPRSGGWISSLFKNNPGVPRLGQRAVKPLVEKVFTGKNFSDLDIHPHCVANLQQNLNLKEMMTVQQKAIPVILQGRDVLIRSQTGSGKTLSYALPIIEGLQAIRPKINRHDGIRVVIVVPTRELAVQTYELLIKLVKPFTWLVPGLLSGGQKRKSEKAILRKGLNVLVGTPGRINDHLRHTQSLNFCKTGCLVLDEADRLLDMGYEKDVAAIVKAIEDHKKNAAYDPMALVKKTFIKNPDDEGGEEVPDEKSGEEKYKHHLTEIFLSKERQTILLSATLTKAVENLAGITMVDPVFIDTSEGRAVIADSLNPKLDKPGSVMKVGEPTKKKEKIVKDESMDEDDESTATKEVEKEKKRGDLITDGTKLNKKKSKVPATAAEDSDSDSDYEYFKVQKELETKKGTVDMDTDEEEEHQKVNTFNDALKSAIQEDELVLPSSVNQTFMVVPMKLRLVTLCALIVEHCVNNKKGGKMIVFMATLEMVDYHSELIETVLTGEKVKVKKKDNKKSKKKKSDDQSDEDSSSDSDFAADYQQEGSLVPVELEMFSLHGSMPHERRMEVFKQFRLAKRGVLICTDVAARGIDVPRVDLVLQYCAPASATDYVHRVGRTGRATAVGAAVLMLLPSETDFVRYLEEKRIRLRQSDESSALDALRSVAVATTTPRAAVAVQARLEATAHSNRDWLARASRAYTSWVRFYSGYPRDVREHLDARKLHLGHAAKAFALRDTPAALAKRTKNDPELQKEKPKNRLTVHEEEEKKRPGFPRVKVGSLAKLTNKQSSMHTASEFDSGLEPVEHQPKRNKKKNK